MLNQLLDRRAISGWAEKYGFRAGDNLVNSEIRRIPAFAGPDGKFSEALYRQTIAQRLDAENRQLRTMLHFVPDPRSSFISARVIGDHTGAFVREVLISAGEKSGLRKGQAAMTGDGLAGRVSEVGARSARVLLLTDINSRVPVVVERTRDRAILAGDNSNRPQLLYLKPGLHRIGVTTQFDPVVELRFLVDPRYTNRASVTFDKDHRIGIRRVAQ